MKSSRKVDFRIKNRYDGHIFNTGICLFLCGLKG